MAVAMTFDSLQDDLRRYLERGYVTDETVFEQLPRLINLAERQIAMELNILGFKVPLNTTFAAGTSTYAKPDRWRSTASFWIGTDGANPALIGNSRRPLFAREYEWCRYYWPDSDQRDVPEYYSDYDYSNWLIVPTPAVAYPVEVVCYMQPAFLEDTNQTNWLSLYAPNALLMQSLLQASPFLKQDDRVATWQQMYSTAVAALSGKDLQRIIDNSVTREQD